MDDGGKSKGGAGGGTSAGKVGLRDLARMAAVDISTVSRALRHDPRISETRARMIRELARREGYRPRPLRSKRTRAIGVLIGSDRPGSIGGPGEHFLARIAWIAQQLLGRRRMHVNLECFLRNAGGHALPAVIHENRVDGVLIAGHPPVEMVARIREQGLPAVAINDTAARLGIPCLRSDPRRAMREAIIRLAAWGHQRFGLLMNDLECPTSRARLEAYEETLAAIDIPVDGDLVVSELPGEIAGGREGVRALAKRGELPSALLCCNDWVALGALMELQGRGVAVPGQVSIVGHDDVPFCATLEPALTSISRSEQVMVSRALAMLFDQIEGRPAPADDRLVEGSVVWRDSTGAAPARSAAANNGRETTARKRAAARRRPPGKRAAEVPATGVAG